jgi:hypothetical protein
MFGGFATTQARDERVESCDVWWSRTRAEHASVHNRECCRRVCRKLFSEKYNLFSLESSDVAIAVDSF